MSKLFMILGVTALAVFSTAAFADDPFLIQDGSSCPGGGAWCGTSTQTVDATTGMDTIEYTFSSAVIPDIAADWSGWAEGTIGGNEAELLHFVTGGTVLSPTYSVFLYCGASIAICSSKDNVLPEWENGKVTATWNMGAAGTGLYNPDSSGDTGTKPGSGQYSAGNPIGYGLGAPTTGAVKGTIPEPSSVVLLGAMMIALAGIARTKFAAKV